MSLIVRPCAFWPKDRQSSPTYYELLGLSPKEQEPQVIEEAALVCAERIRAYQLTCESECTLALKEIAEALIVLLNPVSRREYDLNLNKQHSPTPSERRPPVSLGVPNASAIWREESIVQHIGQAKACDVKLVYRGFPGQSPSLR